MKNILQQPISELHGVGPAMEKKLLHLGLRTFEDLIWYLPRQYEDRSNVIDIIDVTDGMNVTIEGDITKLAVRHGYRKKRMTITQAEIADDTAEIQITWFNQPYIANSLKVGDRVFISGKVKKTKYGIGFQSPVYEKIQTGKTTVHSGRIVPKYPLTQGITQKQLRYFVKQALEKCLPIEDYLPAEIIKAYSLMTLSVALEQIHFPDTDESYSKAHTRIDFDDLYIRQLYGLLQREARNTEKAELIPFQEKDIKKFVQSLPYTLTDAQRKATWEIFQDIQKTSPMSRLIIGDVGSGKTIVAAMAMFNVILSGRQAVFMAPTEILAKQHLATFQKLFKNHQVTIELMTSSTRKKKRKGQIPTLQPDIIIGTHALIQSGVTFNDLALAVIDEQHRFGVHQRHLLTQHSGDIKTAPHFLSMTATPIPRTLALALYGDLDISIIDDMPPGRKRVHTNIIPPKKRPSAYTFIQERIAEGEQCFIICPLIDPSDSLGVQSVTDEYEKLISGPFKKLSVEMLHGKMKSAEKNAVMQRMKNKEIDILIATSVIEVGVDIPNATVMMIEGAERFGLAQLHQFRGRVGRSNTQSYCLLFSNSSSPKTTERLQALVDSNDGFALAEKDLALRGAGEVFGTDQSGFSEIAALTFQRPDLVESAGIAAEKSLKEGWFESSKILQQKMNTFIHNVHLE